MYRNNTVLLQPTEIKEQPSFSSSESLELLSMLLLASGNVCKLFCSRSMSSIDERAAPLNQFDSNLPPDTYYFPTIVN